MNVYSDLQNDVVRTIQFDDCDDCIHPSKSDVTGSITEPQVDILAYHWNNDIGAILVISWF